MPLSSTTIASSASASASASSSTSASAPTSISSKSKSKSMPMTTSTKENNGENAKKRRSIFLFKRFVVVACGMLLLYLCVHKISNSRKMVNKRSRKKRFITSTKKGGGTTTTNNVVDEQTIVEGYLTLIDISVGRMKKSTSFHQYQAQGTFCQLDWTQQQKNPSTVAMFRDLMTKSSKLCARTTIIVDDLYEITQQARAYDDKHKNKNNKNAKQEIGIPLPKPTGVVFHETRCGSTLFANLLAGFAPQQSRVYSESPPPVTALKACDGKNDDVCDPKLQTQLIRDVFYLMGRRRRVQTTVVDVTEDDTDNEQSQAQAQAQAQGNGPQYVFYKIQSIGALSIDKFTMAFPDVPWVFVFRDTVEIMQSHFKTLTPDTVNTIIGGDTNHKPVCARNFGRSQKQQPSTTRQVIRAGLLKEKKSNNDDNTSSRNVNMIEYCAAHLGGLALSALQEYDRSNSVGSSSTKKEARATTTATTTTPSMGRFVNYADMPDIVWKEILPHHFHVEDDSTAYKSNMEKVALVYSKGRGGKANKEWNEDTTHKQATAVKEVIEAADLFTKDIYHRMNELSATATSTST